MAATLPRVVVGTVFVTPDEDNWMRRTGNFARGLERGQLERTFQSGHPGVTTMWVARLGIGPEASRLAGITATDGPITRLPRFLELLSRARTAFAVVNAGLVVLIALLTWRLFGPGPAALAGLLMAFDPFLIAHSQIVHLDALSAGFIVTSALAGGVFWWAGGSAAYLGICAVAAGLAVLTKAPALFLGGFLPLIAVGAHVTGRTRWATAHGSRDRVGWWDLFRSLIACGLGVLVTIFALWPALWVAPLGTIRRAVEYQLLTAGTPHGPGNFFLGQPTGDPGSLFYPVAVAMRLTPFVVGGLIALAVLLPPRGLRSYALLLVDFLIGFGLFLALASKKLDRYALPMFPVLAILAGLGLWLLWRRVWPAAGALAHGVALGAIALGHAAAMASTHPYPLAYYNPLLGGGPAATRALLVGWGEGLDQAAAFINTQPNAADAQIAIYYPLVLNFQGLVTGTVQRFGDPRPADYVVDYVSAAQRGHSPREVAGMPPAHSVQINHIEYVRVYRLVPPRSIGAAPVVIPPDGAGGESDS